MKKFKYKIIFRPYHPNAYSNGQIQEHRYIMSEHLGRPLKKDEWVHHIDENPLNNDIKNLRLTTRQEHPKIHLAGKPLPKWHRKKLSKSHLGQKAWNKGIKLPYQVWNKGLKYSCLNPAKFKKVLIPWNKNKHTGIVTKTSFKKGHIPWSKSQKGVCLNTGRTHFKKGQIPWNKKIHN